MKNKKYSKIKLFAIINKRNDKNEWTSNKKGFKYYHIDNPDYLEKCLVLLKELNKNSSLKKEILKIQERMLEDEDYLKSLWNKKDLEEILAKSKITFLTNTFY